jgi:hypothetical protein
MSFSDKDDAPGVLFPKRTSIGQALWSQLWAFFAVPVFWIVLVGVFDFGVISGLFLAVVLALLCHFGTWTLLRKFSPSLTHKRND